MFYSILLNEINLAQMRSLSLCNVSLNNKNRLRRVSHWDKGCFHDCYLHPYTTPLRSGFVLIHIITLSVESVATTRGRGNPQPSRHDESINSMTAALF